MNKKTFETLEFDKIRETLKTYAVMDITKSQISRLCPCDNIKKANFMQEETAQGCEVITKKGNPPIYCVSDIRERVLKEQSFRAFCPLESFGQLQSFLRQQESLSCILMI